MCSAYCIYNQVLYFNQLDIYIYIYPCIIGCILHKFENKLHVKRLGSPGNVYPGTPRYVSL